MSASMRYAARGDKPGLGVVVSVALPLGDRLPPLVFPPLLQPAWYTRGALFIDRVQATVDHDRLECVTPEHRGKGR